MVELAEVPYGYKFTARNSYVKAKMLWHIVIVGGVDKDYAAWRVLDSMNQFPINDGDLVAVKGEAREVDET